ncbi:MAG: hypothetical protein QOI74_1463 [Micromonosporaceae bacterium]|nr:hypothetical protein [Micromonosporaceae bacterium]
MPSPPATPRSTVRAAAVRFAILIALVTGLGLTTLLVHPSRHGLLAAAHHSHLAPMVTVCGSALLIVALTPRTLLSFVGGALFGTLAGAGYVLLGVAAGGLLAFFVGRYLGRAFVARHLHGRLAQIERAVARRALVAVVISRLIPLVPFGVSNYALGTSSVGIGPYLAGTLIGATPATLAYAALGAATMRGDPGGAAWAGGAVVVLGVSGSIGTFLLWRRRPRRQPPTLAAPALPPR